MKIYQFSNLIKGWSPVKLDQFLKRRSSMKINQFFKFKKTSSPVKIDQFLKWEVAHENIIVFLILERVRRP
jgi:hypothetical protein